MDDIYAHSGNMPAVMAETVGGQAFRALVGMQCVFVIVM